MSSDSPVAVPFNSSGVEIATNANPVRVDPTGTTTQPISGSVTASQSTAANLNATVIGSGSAGTPASGVVTVQGISGGTAQPVSRTVIANPTDVTGTITTIGGSVQAASQGWSSVAVVLTGTWTGSVAYQMSVDGGTTWVNGGFAVPPVTPPPVVGLAATVATNGTYQVIGLGCSTHVRVIAATAVTGTIGVRIVLGDAPPIMTSTFSEIVQNVTASTANSTTANLAVGASFTGTAESTLGVAAIQKMLFSDQPIFVQLQQSTNGTNWDISDQHINIANVAGSRTVQAVGSFFRIIIANIGNATTTVLRLGTTLCPTVEALPRNITPNEKLAIATPTTGWVPSDKNFTVHKGQSELYTNVDGTLSTWSTCLTDANSFRDDFPGSNIYATIAGTTYFTNGSAYVTGTGTSFTSLRKSQYIKLSSHADTAYMQILDIYSDTFLVLVGAYSGATANGTGWASSWVPSVGTGATLSVASSIVSLASGTTSGTTNEIMRIGDYLPYTIQAYVAISQRIANQESVFGLADASSSPNNQALVVFDGTTNTTVKFRTGSLSTDAQETTVTLPGGATTNNYNTYTIDALQNRCALFINDIKVAEHKIHVPGVYSAMSYYVRIRNTGAAAGSTTLTVDTISLNNYNRVEVSTTGKSDSLSVKEIRSGNSAVTSVSAAVADTSLLALNTNRTGFSIFNDSTAILYLKFGTGASTTSFTVKMVGSSYFEDAFGYVGAVNGYWSAANGSARITEMS